jgi:hypothetical protein
MKQVPMIYGIGPSPAYSPAVPTAVPFRAEAQTVDGVWLLNVSFEGAKDLHLALESYLKTHSAGR